jgi:hypothetical protein
MKFQAHPLVVAAALGLIGPGALAEEDEPEAEALCGGAGPSRDSVGALAGGDSTIEELALDRLGEPLGVAPQPEEWTWVPGEAPDAEAFHRVEIAWLKESQGR